MSLYGELRRGVMVAGAAVACPGWALAAEADEVARSGWSWLLAGGVTAGLVVAGWRWRRGRRRRSSNMDQHWRELLALTDLMVWEAEVQQRGAELEWSFKLIQPSRLYRRLHREQPPVPFRHLWRGVVLPDLPEMDRRSVAAMRGGAAGYEQEYRVCCGGQTHWLHENVAIERIGPERWHVAGVITEVTAKHEAGEAQRAYQSQLARILEAVGCVLWQAQVVDRAGAALQWSLFIPPSGLYRAIFGEDPGPVPLFHWDRVLDPATRQRIDALADRALRDGERGYTQEFPVQCHDGRQRWLQEQVTVERAAPGEWSLVGVLTDVTPRHAAEEASREHQRQLERIFGVVDCLLWRAEVEVRPSGEYVWLVYVPSSNLYHKLFGTAQPDPRTALNWNEANVPEHSEMERRSAEALRSGAPGYEQEFRAYVGGRMYWLFERAAIRRTAADRFEVVGVVVDVTATRTAEQEVRQSEERYRTLFRHTPVAMIEADFSAVGRWLEELRAAGVADLAAHMAGDAARVWHGASLVGLVDCNDMALRVLGAESLADLQARRRWLRSGDAVAAIRGVFQAVAEGRSTFETELGMLDLAGRARRMLLRWWIGRASGGLDLRRAVLVLVDLTELKRAEAELAAEKERLAVTLRAMAEGVVTTDTAGCVQFLNPAAAALLRWPAERAVGRAVDEVCALRVAERDEMVPVPIAAALRGDAVAELPAGSELVASTGERRLVEGCCAPIHAADSTVIGAVLVLRDVTERERLEQELVRASKLESVGLLAGGIAHDFNNILTAVMGNLALSLLDVDAESDLGRALRDAERAALRARDLTQQLLTFARGGDPIRAAVRLPEIVAEVTRFALHGAKVKAEFDLAPDLWPADVDKAQIGRVVQNLVLNAVQAMPAGGVVRIAASNQRVGGHELPPLAPGAYVHIAVADTGVGIKAEHLERIFEPYFTTKQTGSGLGLATVYSIVRKHKGHVRVESVLGAGTTFDVYLPAAERGLPAAEATAPATTGALRGRVLFMDDEAPIRQLATTLLRRLGCESEVAADGETAVERYRAERAAGRGFDAVVMDLTVPGGMGGLEALERMKAIDPQVRAIVSSGYSSDPVLANFRDYGFRGRVAKPYEIAEFGRVLRAVLGGG